MNKNGNPQQIIEKFDNLTIDSCFDSGNMQKVSLNGKDHYNIWIAPDCYKTEYVKHYYGWFYFRVTEMKVSSQIIFTIKNIKGQGKLFEQGMCPVVSNDNQDSFKPLPQYDVQFEKINAHHELTFKYTFTTSDPHFFAFTYPYSYQQLQKQLQEYETKFKDHPRIYFHRELIAESLEGRRIDLLTITNNNKMNKEREVLQINKQIRPFTFKKRYVFLSARVHPGEIPASHTMNGVLKYILNSTNEILDHFVFVIVPMINPDGVYRGHWRVDTIGQNLNRFYSRPDKDLQPSVYAIDQIVQSLQSKIFLYLDMHAHSGKKGCFIYGNALEYQNQINTHLFNRLISLNSRDFEYETCNFTEKNMYMADKSDGLSKEGSGRVSFYKKYQINHSYTIECNYVLGHHRNQDYKLVELQEKEKFSNKEFKIWYESKAGENLNKGESDIYTLKTYKFVGRGICQALMDITETSKFSRLPSTPFLKLENLKYFIAVKLIQTAPYRFEANLRTFLKGLTENKDMFLGSFQLLKALLDKEYKKQESKEGKENIKKNEINALNVVKTMKQRNYSLKQGVQKGQTVKLPSLKKEQKSKHDIELN